jgi:hypothetical protein
MEVAEAAEAEVVEMEAAEAAEVEECIRGGSMYQKYQNALEEHRGGWS